MVTNAWSRHLAIARTPWPVLLRCILFLGPWVMYVNGMTDETIASLRQDTRNLFYHGYTNYLAHAFPEDELKPLSCKPQTRNRENPADIGLNDVLGNYSLTLIDSLSTLAILASDQSASDGHNAQKDFRHGVRSLVELYGDGWKGSCGTRACGFDLDSKVQVFETNIRGVGGLLSAHLFAIGALPIRGYNPSWQNLPNGTKVIDWDGWNYDNQLLRLAHDLASRLLPAFSTSTGLPYPRVNLRTGIYFYRQADTGVCNLDGTSTESIEITETCTAGAGSLILEFTTLSRLTGDPRFEFLAKKAFWSVWNRRSNIGLVGAGIDAESGEWVSPALAGVGAGVDSFFEYALKSHILLANLPYDTSKVDEESAESFLNVWEQAHAAVKRHVYRNSQAEKHPFYGQADLYTGAPRYSWIDNLSAYYPGLLTLAGELEEAIESYLLYAALWTRYSAIPERWQTFNGAIDTHFKHWAGRPEFIESTYHIYQATKDPFYLHVGEMALRDIKRRCWTNCGWTDLADVVSGEQRDRMESFFLGETAKYLYLLFQPNHPMNHLDAPVVFSTEGHPLTVPRARGRAPPAHLLQAIRNVERQMPESTAACPIPPLSLPLTVSNAANRSDLFHAAALVNLHLMPINPTPESPILESSGSSPGISMSDVHSPTNYTFYPWTLPSDLVPANGYSSRIRNLHVSSLTFPNLFPGVTDVQKNLLQIGSLQKILEGVLIKSLSNIRLNMIEEPKSLILPDGQGSTVEVEIGKEFRVQGVANWALGRDEKVVLSHEALRGVSPTDPHFTRMKDLEMVDLVIDVFTELIDSEEPNVNLDAEDAEDSSANHTGSTETLWGDLEAMVTKLLVGSIPVLNRNNFSSSSDKPKFTRQYIPAILPTGVGAAPLPASIDDDVDVFGLPLGSLPFHRILFLDDTLCTHQLPGSVAKAYPVIIIKRGDCSFNEKLANIPAVAPGADGLQLVIIISVADDEPRADSEESFDEESNENYGSIDGSANLIRPLLDVPQLTPNGLERRHPVAMLMCDGDPETILALYSIATTVAVFDRNGEVVSLPNPTGGDRLRTGKDGSPGIAVKRRFWFESNGVPIKNLIML